MPTMSFNEFQRELQKQNVDERTAYFMTLMYEQITEIAQQGEQQSRLVLELANSMQGIVGLHEQTQKLVTDLAKFGKGVPGVHIASEPIEN